MLEQQDSYFVNIKESLDDSLDLVSAEIEYNSSYYSDSLFYKNSIFLPESINCAAKKRKAEYFVGRYASKLCLQKFGFSQHAVTSGAHREPVWPKGIVGSISHTSTHAIVTLSQKSFYQSIGVDVENWINQKSAREISKQVLSPRELFLRVESTFSYEEFITLVFSAKESFFKALFPFVDTYFEFSDTELKSIDVNSGTVTLVLTKNLGKLKLGTVYKVQYSKRCFGIHTILLIS